VFPAKEDFEMSIIELYHCLQPLINFLGTICLIALVSGGTVFALVWIVKKLWKYILAFGAISFVLFSLVLILGAP
jgi:hypothetical protein